MHRYKIVFYGESLTMGDVIIEAYTAEDALTIFAARQKAEKTARHYVGDVKDVVALEDPKKGGA